MLFSQFVDLCKMGKSSSKCSHTFKNQKDYKDFGDNHSPVLSFMLNFHSAFTGEIFSVHFRLLTFIMGK